MNNHKAECEKCKKIISTNNLKKHLSACNGHGLKSDRIKNKKEIEVQFGLHCDVCKVFQPSAKSLANHKKFCSRNFEELGRRNKRDLLIKESNYSCSKCGFNKTREDGKSILEIDHIDGDHTNNTRENLRVLCPNCHALTHNFRNWGRSSKQKTSKRIRKGNKLFNTPM